MVSDGIAPSISVSGIDEPLLFLRRQKSDLDRVSLSPLHVLFRKTRPRCCDLELVIENLVQLADMVCGSVYRSMLTGKKDQHVYRAIVEEKALERIRIWP